jgi:hypothetical protein
MRNHIDDTLKEASTMRVIPIRSKMMFRDFNPRTKESVSEGAKFLCGATLTFWGPTLMACLVLGQAMPFYWTLATDALGILWGVLMYNKPSGGWPSCVPVNRAPNVPSVVRVFPKVGKAA